LNLRIFNNAKDAIISKKISNAEISGVIKITIENTEDRDRIIVSIKDNGGGIPKEIIGKIFEPYFTTKESTGGTGVGLYMSKTIIETNMGGTLTVKNVDGGVEFIITLDVADENDEING
jgi:signal transduction histidine kinase